MCEVHKPDKLQGIDIKIANLSPEDLQNLPTEGAFVETEFYSQKYFLRG